MTEKEINEEYNKHANALLKLVGKFLVPIVEITDTVRRITFLERELDTLKKREAECQKSEQKTEDMKS